MLRNLRLKTRAALSFGLICLLLILLSVIALSKMSDINQAAKALGTDWMPSVRQADVIEADTLRLRLALLHYVTEDDKANLRNTLEARRDALKKSLADYEADVSSTQEGQLYENLKRSTTGYLDALKPILTSSVPADQLVAYVNTTTVPLANAAQTDVDALVALNNTGAEAAYTSAQAQYQHGLVITGSIIALAIVLTLLVALLFTRSVVLPVQKLMGVTREIAQGRLGSVVEVNGADEITELQSATEAMQSNLRSTLQLITDSAVQLAAAAEELAQITQQARQGISRQGQETELAATAVNQMTAAVEEVARSATFAAQATQASQQSAAQGRERVVQTLSSIARLSDSVASTSDQVSQLANQTQSISQVLEVIRAIAEQTNLLALNAAIEAARAGEQGRGFAVVADEVRALAHRTQSSTQDIEKMIAGIKLGSQQAVQAMAVSSSEAGQTLRVAQEAGEAIHRITDAIGEISEKNLVIASASEQQAQVARSVDHNLVSIKDLAGHSASAATQTAEASAELSRLAVNLNGVVARFSF
ncbi:methyl-accepting chemotaxis protein [Pseudomonas sp. KNUC1026]|nr:methyl-accepting chemotaxis protein [Pseudomonas sp. KNUC1026]UFH50767.1 methyl-accepting chemotaxis protein [Pseudomonas sp. KNUC1026]